MKYVQELETERMDEDFDKSLVVCLTVSVYFNVPTRSVYYKEARSDVYESRNPAPFHAIWYSHAGWLSVMCRYHFTFAVLYIFKQSIVPCMCKWHTRMSVALPPYVRHGHCIYFYFFLSRLGFAGILQQLGKREPTTFTQHLSTFGNKWRCFE